MKRKSHPESSDEARAIGFIHDFASTNDGKIYCIAIPEKLYSFGEYKALGVISDTLRKCAVVRIETVDGLLGLRDDFWEV